MCLAVDAGGWPGQYPLAGRTSFSSPDSLCPPPSPARKPRPSRCPAPPLTPVCMAPLSPLPAPLLLPSRGNFHFLHPVSSVTLDFSWGFLFRRAASFLAFLPAPTGLPAFHCLHLGFREQELGSPAGNPIWKREPGCLPLFPGAFSPVAQVTYPTNTLLGVQLYPQCHVKSRGKLGCYKSCCGPVLPFEPPICPLCSWKQYSLTHPKLGTHHVPP